MSSDPDLRRDTALAQALIARIRRNGPLPVKDYMAACLSDPDHGYYRTRSAIGRDGDFTTAPEISQVFGELVGLWAAVVWQQMGAPAAIPLVEIGPGRGTLMRDMLRATARVPGFHAALRITLIEPSPVLEAMQRVTLAGAGMPVAWESNLGGAAAGTAIVVANEFLDCLPMRQLVRSVDGWAERCVGLDGAGRLQFTTGARVPPGDVPMGDEIPGTIVELADFSEVRNFLAGFDAVAALFIDYGDATGRGPRFGDTLQAVRGHVFEHPLTSPGEADLTVQVDFVRLIADMTAAPGLSVDGPVTQATFLGVLGAVERASRLMAANPQLALAIETQVARLLAPAGMGGRFKVAGVRSHKLMPLPGLAAAVPDSPGG